MAYKTGRTRTLKCSGTLTGHSVVSNMPPVSGPCGPSGAGVPGLFSDHFASIGALGMTIDYSLTGPSDGAGPGPGSWGARIHCGINRFGVNVNAGATDYGIWGPYPVCDPRFASSYSAQTNVLNGSYSMEVQVEQWVEISSTGAFPTIGGAASEDYPYEQKVTFYEVPVMGSTVTCRFTLNGLVAVATGTVTVQDTIDYSVGGRLGCETASFSNTGGDIATSNDFLDAGLGAGYHRTEHQVTANVSGLAASVTISSGGTQGQSGTVLFSGSAPKPYSISGVIRAWNDAYPNPLTVKIDRAANDTGHSLAVTSGVFSDSNTQHQYGASSNLNGVPEGDYSLSPIDVNEYADLRVWVDPASLTALNEDPTDWRILMRGWSFGTGLTYTQAASLSVDSGSTLTPTGDYRGAWTGTSASVTQSGGAINIAPTSPGGVGHRSFTIAGGSGFGGYRYLKLHVSADADGRTFGVTIGVKTWTHDYLGNPLTANSAAADIYIDLLYPSNPASNTDDTDSRWTLPAVDGPLSGVTALTNLDITGVANGATLKIASMDLSRCPSGGYSRITAMPCRNGLFLEQPPVSSGSVTTSTYVRRYLQGDTDSRLSLEISDFRKVVVDSSGATTITYNESTLATLAAAQTPNPALEPTPIYPGWVPAGTTVATDPPSGGNLTDWLNCNRPAYWAYGSGALFSVFSPATVNDWHYGIDLDASSGASIPAQAVFDVLAWHPGCGDVFSFTDGVGRGAYVGGITVAAAKIMRGQAWGAVADSSGLPSVGTTVELQLASDHSTAGSATTGAEGQYYTGSPYGKGLLTYDTIVDIGSMPFPKVTRAFTDRRRHRAGFSLQAVWKYVWTVRDYTRRLFFMTVDNLGHLARLLYWDDDTTPIRTTVDSSPKCSFPTLHLNNTYLEGVYLQDTTAMFYRTTDHGANWIMSAISNAYAYDAICSAEQFNRLVLVGYHTVNTPPGDTNATGWYVQVGKLQDDGTYVWSNPVSMGLSTAKAFGHLLCRPDGVLQFAYLDSSSMPQLVHCYALALDATGSWA